MNKTITKTLVAGLVCLAFCGTTFAAPGCGNGGREPQKAPVQQKQKAPEHNGGRQTPAPANHRAPEHHAAPVAHHTPPPEHHEPPPPPPEHHGETTGWTVLGAVVGGIVGACL